MVDFKTRLVYICIGLGVGYGVGQIATRGKNKKESANAVVNVRKARLTAKRPQRIEPVKSETAVEKPIGEPVEKLSDSHPEMPKNTHEEISSAALSGASSMAKVASELQALLPIPTKAEPSPSVTDNGAQGSEGTPSKVRILNAYRTRTFWTPGPIMNDMRNFTIMVETKQDQDTSLKPRIDWKVGKTQGTLWGVASKNIQTITLPWEAWRLDEPSVEVNLKVGAARDGEDFSGPTESANLTIKSLSSAVEGSGAVIHLSHPLRNKGPGTGWLTSWNKVKPGKDVLSIYLPPRAELTPIWPMLQSAADFTIESEFTVKEPMAVFANQDKVLFGIVGGSLPTKNRSQLLEKLGVVLTYKGLPSQYLGDLRGNPATISTRVMAAAVGDSVILYRPDPKNPFGSVPKKLINPGNVELLRKEGVALFTHTVEAVNYMVH